MNSGHEPTAAGRIAFEPREFSYNVRDFRTIARILRGDVGIDLAEMKAPLVYSRLVKRLRALGLESFKSYCALVESENGAAERQHMIAALTTNVTRFFREPHHFEHLKLKVLPDLLEKARRGAAIRLWSAGCSSGEEPYSIALTILSLMRDAAKFDVKILAVDINKNVVAQGMKGIYSEAALEPVSRQQRADWFATSRGPDGRKIWRVGDDMRSLVVFRPLNLIGPWPMRKSYGAIFCRNVAIYFDERTRAQIWTRMASQLTPGGYLYVGHSERVTDSESRYQLDGYTTYRLKEGAVT